MRDPKKVTIDDVVRVRLFPRGLAELCEDGWEEQFDEWVERLRERLKRTCDPKVSDTEVGEAGSTDVPPCSGVPHFYCELVPVPNPNPPGPACWEEVCYDELGRVVCRGPVRCPHG